MAFVQRVEIRRFRSRCPWEAASVVLDNRILANADDIHEAFGPRGGVLPPPEKLAPLFVFFQRFSAYSLTVHALHHIAHLWPLWVYGIWRHDEPSYYWRQAQSERHGRYSVETAMRWLCD